MTKKLINRFSLVSMALGVICLIAKAMSNEYVDSQGILHEPFFLLPIGFALIFLGMLIFGIFHIISFIKKH